MFFCLLVDTLLAVIGTTVLAVDFVFHPHSVAQIMLREVGLIIFLAAGIGFFIKRLRPQDNAARWVWVLPTLWLVLGLMIRHDFLIGRASIQREGVFFFAFTVPAIRAAAFSVGALVAQ